MIAMPSQTTWEAWEVVTTLHFAKTVTTGMSLMTSMFQVLKHKELKKLLSQVLPTTFSTEDVIGMKTTLKMVSTLMIWHMYQTLSSLRKRKNEKIYNNNKMYS